MSSKAFVHQVFCRPVLSTILCVCVGAGCNVRFPSLTSTAADKTTESRYQLTKDKDGRVLRLDTVTGEVTVAEPAKAPPTRQRASAPAAAAVVSESRSASPAPPLPAPAAPPTEESHPNVEIPPAPTNTGIDVCGREDLIRNVVTLTDVPVYVDARRMDQPLTTFPSGVMLMVFERSGDWLLLRFQDARFGLRFGYAHCSQLRALDINVG